MSREYSELTDSFTEEEQETEQCQKYLTFWSAKQLFAVPVSCIVQIIGVQEITPIPEFPDYAKGIINLRGMIIPVVDARLRFGKEERAYDEHTCIVIMEISGGKIGYIVDEVDEVLDILPEQIAPPPDFSQAPIIDCLLGIGKLDHKMALMVDMNKVLDRQKFDDVLPEK